MSKCKKCGQSHYWMTPDVCPNKYYFIETSDDDQEIENWNVEYANNIGILGDMLAEYYDSEDFGPDLFSDEGMCVTVITPEGSKVKIKLEAFIEYGGKIISEEPNDIELL